MGNMYNTITLTSFTIFGRNTIAIGTHNNIMNYFISCIIHVYHILVHQPFSKKSGIMIIRTPTHSSKTRCDHCIYHQNLFLSCLYTWHLPYIYISIRNNYSFVPTLKTTSPLYTLVLRL